MPNAGKNSPARSHQTNQCGGGRDRTQPLPCGRAEENSPALKPAADTNMGPFLVLKVNGRRIECLGGDWGMDDAMKRISRERLEPYIRMEHDAHLNMIRNWAGQSTSERRFMICATNTAFWSGDEFWMNTEATITARLITLFSSAMWPIR